MTKRHRQDGFDIVRIGERMASMVDDAVLGLCDWQTVVDAMASEFPGSAAAIHSQDMSSNSMNYAAWANFDLSYTPAYADHYAYVNPYFAAWAEAGNGAVLTASECIDHALLLKTEFYNDWLLPQGGVETGVGIQIRLGNNELIHLPVHYPLGFTERYDRPIGAVIKRMRPALWRSVELSDAYRQTLARASAGTAVLHRGGDAAVVLDRRLRMSEANDAALALLARGAPFVHRDGRLTLQTSDGARFEASVARVLSSAAAPSVKLTVRTTEHAWSLSVLRLPAAPAGRLHLLAPVAQALVVIRDLSGAAEKDLRPLAETFGLTPAETRLCAALAQGLAMSEAARRCAITETTARDRLKTIFNKTGTNRQAELCLLLARWPDA